MRDVCVAPSVHSRCAVVDHGTGIRLLKVVRGSFSQDDRSRFTYAGSQCMAIAFVSLDKHTLYSVLSWRRDDLDHALASGDILFILNLHDNHNIKDDGQSQNSLMNQRFLTTS